MGSVHRLKIFHWIPVVLYENDYVRSCKRETQATYCCRKQQDLVGAVVIKQIYRLDPLFAIHATC